MISLYIHIPFCAQKCTYCSFQILPLDKIKDEDGKSLQAQYVDKICQEISFYGEKYQKEKGEKQEIKTLYFGGGTPSIIGAQNIIKIIETVFENYDTEFLEELSIELNPYPTEEILSFIKILNKKYKKIYRLRYSFGLQSLKTSILHETGRDCTFNGISDFLRKLQSIKQENNIFNGDFIAFGEFKKLKSGEEILRSESVWEFFVNFVRSSFFDSFSVYTLELQSGNERKKPINNEKISDEFHLLKEVIEDAGYHRYEISNFAKSGTRSLHNMVYRQQGEWLGFGTSATSFFKKNTEKSDKTEKNQINIKTSNLSALLSDSSNLSVAYRKTNTYNIFEYLKQNFDTKKSFFDLPAACLTGSQGRQGVFLDKINKKEELTALDVQIEKAFLGLRTDLGIKLDETDTKSIFVENRKNLVLKLEEQGLLIYEDDKIILTGKGMNIYNSIITELFKDI